MKIYFVLSVETTNLETWQPFPGATEFIDEYAKFSDDKTYFRFTDEDIFNTAISFLEKNNLKFKRFYEVSFENDGEIKKYPVLLAAISSVYNELLKNGKINAKLFGKKNIVREMPSQKIFCTGKAKDFFMEKVRDLDFKKIDSTVPDKSFYEITDLPKLNYPLIFKNAVGVNETPNYKDKFAIVDPDGRMTFEAAAIDQIAINRISQCFDFSFNKKIYQSPVPWVVLSGEFAAELSGFFDEDTDNFNLKPLTLELI